MRRVAWTCLLTAALLLAPALFRKASASSSCVDVALVLAVDASASVSAGEYHLQRDGIAAAFRDEGVLDAIARAGRVAVTVMYWGSDNQPKPHSDWLLVADGAGAEDFARAVEATPRQVTGDTGLAAGLLAALSMFESLGTCAVRRIVNLSGDGEETDALRGQRRSATPVDARDLAHAMGVEINALAISGEGGLARYYADNVVTSPAGFVMEAGTYRDFAVALRRKLIREIGPQAVSAVQPDLALGRRF